MRNTKPGRFSKYPFASTTATYYLIHNYTHKHTDRNITTWIFKEGPCHTFSFGKTIVASHR